MKPVPMPTKREEATVYAFAKQMFTVRRVKAALEKHFGRPLASTPLREDVDGSVEITDRLHVQIGLDYVIVNLWDESRTVLKARPARPGWRYVQADLEEALAEICRGGT